MNMIVTADDNWAIGHRGKTLVNIPSDEKFCREITAGKVVVMSRKRLESFSQGKPLPNRTNIVLSADPRFHSKDVIVVRSLEALMEELKKYPSEDIFVIGGGSIYRQLLPFCDLIHLTRIHHRFQADVWFPNLDEMKDWEITADSEEQTYFDLEYHFFRYERVPHF